MNLDKIYRFAKNILQEDTTAHDWKHALRVEKNALAISPSHLTTDEINVIKASCWLHDTIDPKLSTAKRVTPADIKVFLKEADATAAEIETIIYIIQNLSYSKNLEQKRELDSLGQIVQDADRLDAIGAIGIARAFYYGGSKQHQLYNDTQPRALNDMTEDNYRAQESVINHFYEKLLVLEHSMNTPEAQAMARIRTQRMEDFLQDFFEEIGEQ